MSVWNDRGSDPIAWPLVAVAGLVLMLGACFGGRGPTEMAVAYRGRAPCPAQAAPGAECTALRIVNPTSEAHAATCRLVGTYRNAWLSGGRSEVRLDEIRPWFSAPLVLVVEPDHPGGTSYHVPGVDCVAGG